MVWVLHMTKTLAHVVFIWQEDLFHLSWKRVEWHFNILSVSDFLKFDVGDFLVVNHSWIVSWHVAWEFREVGSHFDLFL